MERAHLFISGRVQGVLFRDSTRRIANKLGVVGFVKNLKDGRVEIVAEGPKDKLLKLIEWSHKGSFFARVSKVEVFWEKASKEFDKFKIEY